ncbi:MAG: hypothetical protein H7246_22060 [Phycisphaerae bacterium]|nr:hypothetical protein [Saprospiraceae bacterium]
MKDLKFGKPLQAMAWMFAFLVPVALYAQRTPYLPDPSYNPLKINVNLIILQRQDGSGNFQDNAADRSFLQNMINVTNQVFSTLVDRNEEYYPGKNLPFLSNAKIEIVPNIIFIKDERGWNNRNDHNFAGVPYLSGWYLDSLDQEIYRNDTLPKAINLYFTTDGQLYEQMVVSAATTDYDNLVFFKQHAASEIPTLRVKVYPYGQYHSMRCHIANVWLKLWWKRQVLHEPDWTMEYESAKSIAHELGHLMGLSHTDDKHIHALMRTRFGGVRDYMTTTEIAKIHESFGLYPSLWQFVQEDVIYGSPSADWVITGEETWTGNRRLYANIIVKTGATLTISSEILIPNDGTITVEQGANLLIEGGMVKRLNGTTEGLFIGSSSKE